MLDRRSESGVPAMRDMAGASLFMRECILIACVHVTANGGVNDMECIVALLVIWIK